MGHRYFFCFCGVERGREAAPRSEARFNVPTRPFGPRQSSVAARRCRCPSTPTRKHVFSFSFFTSRCHARHMLCAAGRECVLLSGGRVP